MPESATLSRSGAPCRAIRLRVGWLAHPPPPACPVAPDHLTRPSSRVPLAKLAIVQRAGAFGRAMALDFCLPLNAPRIRAICRAPICRRAFIGLGSPRPPAGRHHACSPARRHRRGHQRCETSSTDCRCRDFEGSCTVCHSVRVPGRGWHHPPGVARSPSGVPSDRRRVSRNHLR